MVSCTGCATKFARRKRARIRNTQTNAKRMHPDAKNQRGSVHIDYFCKINRAAHPTGPMTVP
ncbi:MAG: hypothetical protein CBARDCOR_2459 [uncultured Caballeronia sp.]|nr:MAG: hypothetical protein CBARDCOR_2459 [uncultured Caballeronia sp.]